MDRVALTPTNRRQAASSFDVYAFDSFVELFKGYLTFRKKRNPRFSYRFYAKKLELKSPAVINFVASGKRISSQKLGERILDEMNLDSAAREYAHTLLALHRTQDVKYKGDLEQRVKVIKHHTLAKVLDVEIAKKFCRWSVAPILEMSNLAGAKWSARWFYERLGRKVELAEVKSVMAMLVDLGFIKVNETGSITRRNVTVETPSGIPLKTLRDVHCQMMDFAKVAVHNQPIEERFFNLTTLNINKDRLDDAKKALDEFRREFAQKFQAKAGEETYQLGLQFFKITDRIGFIEDV